MGFKNSLNDPCIYTGKGDNKVIIALYVDDLIVCGKSLSDIDNVKRELSKRYKMKDLGELKTFLGVEVIQKPSGDVWLGQPSYTKNILKEFNMENSNPIETPAEANAHLVPCEEGDEYNNQKEYQAAVGSLLYLSTKTRPDISFAVGQASRYCSKPSRQHWSAVKRILRYLKGTPTMGILYQINIDNNFVGYSDADWAGDSSDRKSTSGYSFMMQGGCISWASRKQSTVALSTAEAEYAALSSATQEALWLKHLLTELIEDPGPVCIFEDNQATIQIAKNPRFHSRCKHVAIKMHFVRDHVVRGNLEIIHCPSSEMISDVLTKALAKEKFKYFRTLLGMTSM